VRIRSPISALVGNRLYSSPRCPTQEAHEQLVGSRMISRLWLRLREAGRRPPLPARWRRVRASAAGLDALLLEPRVLDGASVLVLLHGSGHSPAVFAPGGSLASLIEADYPALIVMPDGRSSWHLDSPGAQWESGFLRLLRWLADRYPLRVDRAAWGICGFSMGGFGAIRLAAQHPDVFGYASSILGLLDIESLWPEHRALFRLLGPERAAWEAANPLSLVGRLQGIRVRITTGTEAFDRLQNERFVRRSRDVGLSVDYSVLPGGHHIALVSEALPTHLRFHAEAARTLAAGVPSGTHPACSPRRSC
jgi:enterochelin esterase-like enzyme